MRPASESGEVQFCHPALLLRSSLGTWAQGASAGRPSEAGARFGGKRNGRRPSGYAPGVPKTRLCGVSRLRGGGDKLEAVSRHWYAATSESGEVKVKVAEEETGEVSARARVVEGGTRSMMKETA